MVVNIIFRAKSKGVASVALSSASVRANDGLGTDVLSGSGGAKITIVEAATEDITEKEKKPDTLYKTPAAPIISSLTHPDSDKWYANNTVELEWLLPKDVVSIRILVSRKANESPSVVYSPALANKELKELESGVWYFHAQFKNSNGWGQIAHFKFQIDTDKPEYFYMYPIVDSGSTSTVSKLMLDALDQMSGIDYYEVLINNEEKIKWSDDGTKVFIMPELNYGNHTIITKAFDRAGNYLSSSYDFENKKIFLDPPTIFDYQQECIIGSTMLIKGVTYPNADVTILIESDKKGVETVSVVSNKDGIFDHIFNVQRNDIYNISAQVQNEEGLTSDFSIKKIFKVEQPKLLVNLYRIIYVMLAIILLLLIIIVVLIIIKIRPTFDPIFRVEKKRQSRKLKRFCLMKKIITMNLVRKKSDF
jgi:hypothetical protein